MKLPTPHPAPQPGLPAWRPRRPVGYFLLRTLMDLLKTPLGRLRLVGFVEGLSFLVLVGIAMPLKYLAGQPEMVRLVGMVHGALFVSYTFLLIQTAVELGWSFGKTGLGLLASMLPFGTFYADRKLFRPAAHSQQ